MRKIFFSLLIVMSSMSLWAQPDAQKGQPPFDPEKFQQMVEESLTKAANLTAEEAKAFFPLYNEMRSKQREMGKQIFELKKNCKGDVRECAETITKIKQLQVDMALLEQNYYKRMMKVVPAEKVFQVMKAEDDFHRRMVQRQRGDRAGKGSGDKHHKPRNPQEQRK